MEHTAGRYVPLPHSPINASPVPWLTSIHSTRSRGPYGDSRYRGNCSGYLIKDLLRFFKPSHVLDPMSGSGTCHDVCADLGIPCMSFDLKAGQDAADSRSYDGIGPFDFIWMHPPYWRMIRYNDSPRCLSNAKTPYDFEELLRSVLENCSHVLSQHGRVAVLMGDYTDREYGFVSCTYRTKRAAESTGLHQCCTDIIRFQHGNTSSHKTYKSSFIPGLHDVCMIFNATSQRGRSTQNLSDGFRDSPSPFHGTVSSFA